MATEQQKEAPVPTSTAKDGGDVVDAPPGGGDSRADVEKDKLADELDSIAIAPMVPAGDEDDAPPDLFDTVAAAMVAEKQKDGGDVVDAPAGDGNGTGVEEDEFDGIGMIVPMVPSGEDDDASPDLFDSIAAAMAVKQQKDGGDVMGAPGGDGDDAGVEEDEFEIIAMIVPMVATDDYDDALPNLFDSIAAAMAVE